MIYYIYQPCNPSFPIGLVKTGSELLDQLRLTQVDNGGSSD